MTKKALVGRIDYLHTDGSVRESIEYDNESSFIQCIQEETYYGVPFSIVLYKDKDGKTIPTDFLLELDPPPWWGYEVEPAPAEKQSQQHSTIRFAKRQVYNTRDYKKDDGKTVTLVNVALPKGSKYAGYPGCTEKAASVACITPMFTNCAVSSVRRQLIRAGCPLRLGATVNYYATLFPIYSFCQTIKSMNSRSLSKFMSNCKKKRKVFVPLA